MPEHILTKDKYLYSFIDINTYDADRQNPPLKLAITTTGKNIAMFNADNPTIITSEDTLIVHGTEISNSERQTLAKKFYFTGKTLIYKPSWVNGNGYFFFGVNCDGCAILCVPQARETPTPITKFDLPFMFDWSEYNVKVPESSLTKKQSEVNELNEKLQKLELELQEKERIIKKLEQQPGRSDPSGETNDAKIKEFEDKYSKLNQEFEERNEKLMEKERKIKELEEQVSAMVQQQEEKNNNLEKLSEEISTLKLQIQKSNEEINEKGRKNDELREKQSELEGKLLEKDQLFENKIKELEEIELIVKQELDGKKKELEEKESEIKSLEEKQLVFMVQCEEKYREMENEIARLREQIEKNEKEMIEKERRINELMGELQGKEIKLESESISELEQERQIQKKNQQIKKADEEIKRLKEQQTILELEMEKKKAKIIELEQQLQEKDEQIRNSGFQLVTNKLDQILITLLQTGHLRQTLLQPTPIPEIVNSRRCRFTPCKFTISGENLPQFTKQPQLRVSMKNLRVFTPVDENIIGKLPKEEICVYTSDHRFHNNEWWYIKVAEHSNIITMLAFYDGDMDEVSMYGNYVRIPFRPETSLSSNTQFFVGLIRGIGLRFMFMYQVI